MVKFGAIFRLGRITALLCFAIILSGFGLCGSAAQTIPVSFLTAPAPVRRPDKPLGLTPLSSLPLQRITKEAGRAWMAASRRAASRPADVKTAIAEAPTPPPVAQQFQDLTTVPRPPFVGDSTLCFEKQPHWSWDQQFIYFASNHNGPVATYGTTAPPVGSRFHVYRITSGGEFITQITGLNPDEANGEQQYPALNFAQTKLAYVHRDTTGQQQLWVLDFFTNTATVLTGPNANAINNPVSARLRNVERPTWSPNDNVIAFSAVDVNANARNIYTVNVSTKFVTQVTHGTPANGVNCKDPVYDPNSINDPQIVFAANVNGVAGADLNYANRTPLVDLRGDGAPLDVNNNLFRMSEDRITPTAAVQLTSQVADDIEPAFSRSLPPIRPPGGAFFNGYLAWASLGRTAGGLTGNTYDIFFNNGTAEPAVPGPFTTATPVRVFTPDTNGGSVPLNQSDERYPTWSAGIPVQAPVNRIAFSSNRKQVVVNNVATVVVGNVATESDIWTAESQDITPPTLFFYDEANFPGEVLHIANQPLPNPGSRIGQAGDRFYFYARVLDGQYGVESVWVQIKDPDGPSTDAAGQNHRLYGVGTFPGPNSPANNVFVARINGSGTVTHWIHTPFETDCEGISVADYSYYIDGRPASFNYPNRPDDAIGTMARFASKAPGVDDAIAWSGNQNSIFNPIGTSNRPPQDSQGNFLWLQLHDDGVAPDLVAGDNIYSADWVTPLTPSDYYVDLIAYDRAVNPQNPNEQQNWIIYDNVHGFSTQPFTSINPVLYVDDNTSGQRWPRGLKGAFRRFPEFRYGHESEIIDRPAAFHPREWDKVTTDLKTIGDPGVIPLPEPSGMLDFLQNKYTAISWSRRVLQAYHYDWWRILAKGPLPETVLNDYVPSRDEQPRRLADGSFVSVDQPVPERAVVWSAPYTGDIMAGGGSILDQATQAKLTTYRNRSGRLFVNGGDILWALNLGSTGPVFNTFAQDVLGVQTFSADDHPLTAAYSGSPLARAITRDVVTSDFDPLTGMPYWNPLYDIEILGVKSDFTNFIPPYSTDNGTRRTQVIYTADALPYSVNDTFVPRSGFETVFDGVMSVNEDAATQSKTVFMSQSVASMGRFLDAAGDDTDLMARQPLDCLNYRAKISHAMLCWMFSVTLNGQVVNAAQGFAPISGAYVEAVRGNQVVGAAFTNAGGFYQIRGLPVGGWSLRVSSPGFVTFNKDVGGSAHGLTMVLGDFQMTPAPPGSISGKVVDQVGQPVPGVQIRAELQAGQLYTGERNFFATTGPDGTYQINNVPAGDPGVPAAYVVQVETLPPLFQNPTPPTQNANVVTAQDTPNINFTVEGQPGPLTVGVYESVNGAKGAPIADAEVALLTGGTQLMPTGTSGVQPNNPLMTDGSGIAAFTQVPAGAVTVSAFKSGFQEGIAVVAIPQENTVEILLEKAEIRPLYVRVVRAGTPGPQPLQQEDLDTPVSIRLLRKLSRQPIATAQVFAPPVAVPGGNGAEYNLLFPNAQDGDYIVAFEDLNHPRFVGGPGLVEVPVTITSTTPNIAPDLALQGKSGSVTGVVKSTAAGNPPIEGVSVTLTPGGGGAPVTVLTDASGQFNSGTLQSDFYTVTVSKFGYVPPMAPIQVYVAGDRNVGDILMTPAPRGEVYGLVTLSTNGALRDVIVRFTPQGAPEVHFDARSDLSAEAAPDGGTQNYTTALNTTDQTNAPAVNLPQATYTISILGLDGQPDPRFAGFNVSGGTTVVVSGNDQQRKDISLLPASGTITGTVRDANTNVAVSGAIVRVHQGDINGPVVSSVTTGAQGQFTTGVLPGGAYTLEITHPNYNTGSFAQIVEGNITAQPNPLLLTPKPPSTITGTVRSKVDNTLIGGATVQLLRSDGIPVSPAVTDTTTDTLQGSPARNYRLAPVAPPGNYIVRVTKSGWKSAQTAVTVLPGADLNGINFQLDPEFLFGAGLQLIALPDNYGGVDAAALLNLNLNSTPPERTAYWVTDQNRYAIYPEEPARFFTPGKGMFVRLSSPRAFFQSGTPVPNAPFSLPLKTGWNLIGSPFRVRIDWLRVKVQTAGGTLSMQQAMSQGIIQNGLFGYADGYFRSDFLDPFRGYFARAFQDCTLIIPPDNAFVATVPAERFKVAALPAPTPAQVAAELGVPGRGKAPAVRKLNRLSGPRAASPLSGLLISGPGTPGPGSPKTADKLQDDRRRKVSETHQPA